jgi:hypothetical protein
LPVSFEDRGATLPIFFNVSISVWLYPEFSSVSLAGTPVISPSRRWTTDTRARRQRQGAGGNQQRTEQKREYRQQHRHS